MRPRGKEQHDFAAVFGHLVDFTLDVCEIECVKIVAFAKDLLVDEMICEESKEKC